MRRSTGPAVFCVGLYALLSLALPLASIVVRALTEGSAGGSAAIGAEVWMLSGARALGLAGIVAALACAAAYPLAIIVPAPLLFGLFLVSPLARALGVLGLGVQPGALAVGLAELGGALPLAALLVLQRLRGQDPRLLAAAADLGASPWLRFRMITLPLLWPALATAGLWTVLVSIGDIATLELAGGGKFYSLGLVLREVAFAMGDDALLAAITAVLLLLALPCAYVLLRGISALGRGTAALAQVANAPRVRRLAPNQLPLGLVACTALAIAALPFVGLLLLMLRPQVAATVLTPLRYALEPTLRVLPLVAALATLSGFALALRRPRLPIWAGVLIVLPLAIPPAVQGILALEMGRLVGVAPGEWLTLWGLFPTCLAIAYLGGTLAVGGVPAAIGGAAQDLGALVLTRIHRLWWPLLWRPASGVALVLLALTLGAVSVPAFTSGPGGSTLAIALTILARGGGLAAVASITLLLALMPLMLLPMIARLTRRRR